MLPVIGAASIALDAIQSLTSPQPSSQAAGLGSLFPDVADSSSSASPSNSTAVSGSASTQISADNISALINAQSLASIDFGGASDSTADTSTSQSNSASANASSAYNSIDQLVQSTAVPLGFNPFSVSV